MANGRLGSAKINPTNAALLYSNTSGSQAVINIQATGLSSTTNANLALAVDSATVALNQITTATSIPSGDMTQSMYNLDPLSNNRPLRFEYQSNVDASNSATYPATYWNGSAWFKPSSGFYGAPNAQKIDPYFISTPSAYGKTLAQHPIAIRYNTTSQDLRIRYFNLGTMTGQQFANTQQFADPGTAFSGSYDSSYGGFGWSADPYTNYFIGVGTQGFMSSAQVGSSVGDEGGFSSNSVMYNLFGAQTLPNFNHFWYAPRIMGSNGLFVMQPTGRSTGQFAIGDVGLAASMGASGYAYYWISTFSQAAWWYINAPNSTDAHVGWFEYNPNDERYYFEYLGSGNRSIYSFSRATLLAFTSRGTATSYNFSSFATSHGAPPWVTSLVTRPLRIGASLWWTSSNNGNAYVSTDLKTWTLASTYFPANGYPANTFNAVASGSTSYLYAQVSTANISRFSSGFPGVSETAVLEFNTSISNYQRTGIVLSNGDKLYAQNYGSVPISATVMGYEG
ncbi:hypothetical protein UFOVP715_3 [uncultured Caudovirales phage]|uniref:Uncharacterized protein n=1 Tax=uncultured Caudovirales phage TaxID=2100421 RepID=A0A6J5NWH6_9CAUD|nr:hypothetical protein UFOVP715_3 [uncultured Caudovirales phage]